MLRFLPAFILPFLLAFASVFWTHGRFGVLRPGDWLALVLLLLVTPVPAAILALALTHGRLPRRWLLPGAPGRKRAFILGLLAGLLALLVASVALHANYLYVESEPWAPRSWIERYYDRPHLPEVAVLAVATFLAALLTLWPMPRPRPGRCRQCGYDIRYSLASARCPECGAPLLSAM